MRKFLISAAIIGLVGGTSLAMAQDHDRQGGGDRQGGAAPMPAAKRLMPAVALRIPVAPAAARAPRRKPHPRQTPPRPPAAMRSASAKCASIMIRPP